MDNEQLKFKKEDLLERILDFGVKIIKLVNKLPKTPAGFKIGSQIVGSATSLGANTQEAQDASSKADFISKMSIALREVKESKFWLKLIKKSELLKAEEVDLELKEVDELCAIYSTIVKKAKLNLSNVKSQMSNALGFTLIELLIAISIIAVLSAIGLTTFSGIQSKARDSIRKNDLNTLATALEIYYQTNGEYLENSGSCASGPIPADILYTDTNFKKIISGDLPADPKTKNHYCYETDAKGLTYKLYAKLEDGTDYILTSEDYIAQASPTPTPASETITLSPSSPTPTPTPQPSGPLRVFVTGGSTGFYSGFDIGGLAGADEKCRGLAFTAGLPGEAGRWKAWMSDSQTSAASRLNKNGSPYQSVNGIIIANNWQDLTDGTVQNSIVRNQYGDLLNTAAATRLNAVWTNTTPNGERASTFLKDTCGDWKMPDNIASLTDPAAKELASADYSSSVGDYAQTSSGWTATQPNASCYEDNLPIYCFEQIPAP